MAECFLAVESEGLVAEDWLLGGGVVCRQPIFQVQAWWRRHSARSGSPGGAGSRWDAFAGAALGRRLVTLAACGLARGSFLGDEPFPQGVKIAAQYAQRQVPGKAQLAAVARTL